jgi:hypothetical protein
MEALRLLSAFAASGLGELTGQQRALSFSPHQVRRCNHANDVFTYGEGQDTFAYGLCSVKHLNWPAEPVAASTHWTNSLFRVFTCLLYLVSQ